MSLFGDGDSLLPAIQNLSSGLGAQIVIGSVLGDFTIDPASALSRSGNADGENGGGAIALAVFKALGLTITVKLAGASYGPVSVTP